MSTPFTLIPSTYGLQSTRTEKRAAMITKNRSDPKKKKMTKKIYLLYHDNLRKGLLTKRTERSMRVKRASSTNGVRTENPSVNRFFFYLFKFIVTTIISSLIDSQRSCKEQKRGGRKANLSLELEHGIRGAHHFPHVAEISRRLHEDFEGGSEIEFCKLFAFLGREEDGGVELAALR